MRNFDLAPSVVCDAPRLPLTLHTCSSLQRDNSRERTEGGYDGWTPARWFASIRFLLPPFPPSGGKRGVNQQGNQCASHSLPRWSRIGSTLLSVTRLASRRVDTWPIGSIHFSTAWPQTATRSDFHALGVSAGGPEGPCRPWLSSSPGLRLPDIRCSGNWRRKRCFHVPFFCRLAKSRRRRFRAFFPVSCFLERSGCRFSDSRLSLSCCCFAAAAVFRFTPRSVRRDNPKGEEAD